MFDVFIWDMGGHEDNVQKISHKLPHSRIMRYLGTHLDMLRRTATRSRTEYFWVLSSCCDYAKFDFSWMPPVGQEKQLHCWATQDEKFGDTFLVHLPSWLSQQSVEKLEWYQHVNYHPDSVPALPWPLIKIEGNDLAAAVMNNADQALYSAYAVDDNDSPQIGFNKWSKKPVVAFNNTGHVSLCPRDAKAAIKTQIYDWPYIQYLNDPNMEQKPQDVVFISYDEKNAEQNWSRLKQRCSRAKRVHGVDGLFNALKSAAKLSDTPYFYAVFGKTEIMDEFKFNHKPDYLRRPANYIFLAYNPILDHAYGHGGIVMHDKHWLLNSVAHGLDVTMSHDTVTVPEISCVNVMSDSWSAWRTSFRESYKLIKNLETNYSVEDEYHLYLWMTKGMTEFGNDSIQAANLAKKLSANSQEINVNDWQVLRQLYEDNHAGSII